MWRFFLVVFALSIPVFIWGVFWPVHGLPFGLPATAVMVVIPGAVATFEASNARELWRRTFDIRRKRSPRWFLVALLTMPLAVAASYAFMALTGMNLPAARQPFAYGQIAGIAGTFFFGAIFEEIGWTAYATEPLQEQRGVLQAGLLLGGVWALWHVVPWWLGQGHSVSWVAGQTASTVAMRVIMGWIYARGGGSVFLAIVFHSMTTTCYSLFPNEGSHYDPVVVAGVLAVLVGLLLATGQMSWQREWA